MLWPTDFWLASMMPWMMVTRLPAVFYTAMFMPVDKTPRAAPRSSAEIIPFPIRRAAAG